MNSKIEPSRRIKNSRQETDIKTKLFYIFFIAQICAIFCMVVGVIFLILRIINVIK